jgi:Flp pilus assembly protein TadG
MTAHGLRTKGFLTDRRGVAAVEFAMIAPIMLLFYFGLAEFTQAMIAERHAIRTASAIGDLIAQNSEITATGAGGVSDVFAIADTLMKPFPTSGKMKLCVASISADANGAKTVDWSQNKNDSTCPAKNTKITTVSSDLLAANQSVIMSRVIYSYTSPVNQAMKVNPTFTKTFYLRPRRSTTVQCATC